MKYFIVSFIISFNYFVGFYYGMFNFFYSLLLIFSTNSILKYIKLIKLAPLKDFSFSPETPPVSILIPAFNEETVIVRTVKAALLVNYPDFQVIVINDGSEDRTLSVLIETFNLKKINLVYRDIIKTEPIRGYYYNAEIPELLVIDKKKGGKADALNCGVNFSKSPYFCSIDADSVLIKDSLIRLMVPIMKSSVPVVACGGVVRVLNGLTLENGEIKRIQLPKRSLVIFQIIEYLRGFLFGRAGWDAINAILLLSGAFSLFHKDSVLKVGGYDRHNVCEDMELILKLHHFYLKNKEAYKIRFISDPICWTEVPENMKMLARQRRRWQVGLLQSLIKHKIMFLNPKYGRIGFFFIPYYFFFEALGPVIEVVGYFVVIASFLMNIISFNFFLLFLTLAIFYGIFLSIAGIFLEELTYKRYPDWLHFLRLLFFGIFENFGYRQLNSFWRLHGTLKYLFGNKNWEYVKKPGAPEYA